MSTPPNPLIAPPDPTQMMADQAQTMSTAAQGSMNNPMAQAVPDFGGGLASHPIIQKILQGLGQIAQSYGFVGQPPQERLERQQMEQQKAETMARMAQTAAYQKGELGLRGDMVDVARSRADTAQFGAESQDEARKTQAEINKQKLDLSQEQNEWKKDIATGRLDSANKRIENQASQFEKSLDIRSKQVGISQAKLELEQQGLGIKQGFLDLAGAALSQKGTQEGIAALQKLQDLKFAHPIMSQFYGLDDIISQVQKASSAGIPGTTPTGQGSAAPTAIIPAPPQPQTPGATANPLAGNPPINNKVDAKRNQKEKPGGGVTHVWTPNGIHPVGGPQ